MQEELIMKVLQLIPLEEQSSLRDKLRVIFDDYEISPKEKSLALNSDMQRYIILYLTTRKLDGLSEKTLSEYSYKLRVFSEWVPLDIKDVTTMDIRKFLIQYQQEKKIKASSLNSIQTVISTFFNWLEIEDYISKSPARKLNPIKTEKRTRKSLTSEQLEKLRADGCKTERDRALIEVLFSTGGRLSEVSQIDVDKINWNDGSVSVIGKGNKERTVYLSEKAKFYVKKYIDSRPKTDCKALFITERLPYKRLGNRSIQVSLNKIGKNAGFNSSVFPHLMRHTMATLGYKSGMDLPVIQSLLGHQDPSTTQIYAKLDTSVVMHAHSKHMVI